MSQDVRTLCVICAWRENCNKRFSMSGDASMHCPDFSEDISLRQQKKNTTESAEEESE